MPKLYSGVEVVKRLKRFGFETISQKGSHLKLRKSVGRSLRTVIVPMHKQIAQGTLKSILIQAKISKLELDSAK
jgi:predicted RNA binding protein YcfA (HicA-like mRNA interferase family)